MKNEIVFFKPIRKLFIPKFTKKPKNPFLGCRSILSKKLLLNTTY